VVVVRSYRNGVTLASAGGNPNPPKRGDVQGWSAGAVRRHTRKLFSVSGEELTGAGYAVTLTLQRMPTSEEWGVIRSAWIKRAERMPGFVRLHWVVEWQERGHPHLHCAVYGEGWTLREGWLLIGHWLEVAGPFGASIEAQDSKRIDGPIGWLSYMSKHAARGVRHYQRQGTPDGWEKTGRLYGFRGDWPFRDAFELYPTREGAYRLRRLFRSWRIADARSALLSLPPDATPQRIRAARRRLVAARRALRDPDRRRSAVRGMSEWIPEHVVLALGALLELDGQTTPEEDWERSPDRERRNRAVAAADARQRAVVAALTALGAVEVSE
jgi:hypothetical protein